MTDPAPMQTPDAAPQPYATAGAKDVEPKTLTATAGAGAGVIVANFILYLASTVFFHGGAVPHDVQLFVGLIVTIGLAFAGGYFARHVQRPPL